jgi:hypothetical protein
MDKCSATNVANILFIFYFFCCIWTDIDLMLAALLNYVTIITRFSTKTQTQILSDPLVCIKIFRRKSK